MEIIEVGRLDSYTIAVITSDGNIIEVDTRSMAGPGCWYRVAKHLAEQDITDPLGIYASWLTFPILYDPAERSLGEQWHGPNFDKEAFELGKYCALHGYAYLQDIDFNYVADPDTYRFSYSLGWQVGGGTVEDKCFDVLAPVR